MRIKIAMMLCVVTACTLCGFSLAGAAVARRKFLEELASALRKLRIYIVDRIMPVGCALNQTDFPLFSKIAERIDKEQSIYEAWIFAANAERISDRVSDEARNVLNGMFAQLGESGRNMQDELLRGYMREIDEYVEKAKDRAGQVCRIYTSIGFLLGLAIAILLI